MSKKPAIGFVFTQTLHGRDPDDPSENQDFDLTIDKVISKVNKLRDTIVKGQHERLAIYFNLPGKIDFTPDINITVKQGKLDGHGLGVCKGPWTPGDHQGCEHGLRWLTIHGIQGVVSRGGEAEPFLRWLDTLK